MAHGVYLATTFLLSCTCFLFINNSFFLLTYHSCNLIVLPPGFCEFDTSTSFHVYITAPAINELTTFVYAVYYLFFTCTSTVRCIVSR